MSQSGLIPDHFRGRVRLFPLPDLVLFPHVVQPLRVFEPRYVAMLEDALKDDQLIAMALLQPGWEDDYEGVPAIHTVVCVGRVISHTHLPDGSYNLLLAGAMRARVDDEPAADTLYRQADVTLLQDAYQSKSPQGDPALRQSLIRVFRQLNPGGVASDPGVKQLLEQEVPLGVLSDVIAYAVPLRTEDKQRLLASAGVDARTRELIRHLEAINGNTSLSRPFPFPPEFSDN